MPSHVQSHSPPPRRRRVLQERTLAHTNERSPTRSLRMVTEQEDADFYTTTPFPTKPEQILLPIPGKGQQQQQQQQQQEHISDIGFSYADTPGPSTSTWSSPSFSLGAGSSVRAQSIGDSWDVSSTVDAGNSPPQMWDDDPLSSKSSLPEISSGKTPDYSSEGSDAEFSDDEMIVLPTATPTIKAVVSEPPTSPKSASSEESIGYSSPNIQRIGAPSSPNFVTLDNSSVNFLPPRTSHSDSDPRSNSLSSYGTVVRHPVAAPWIHMASSTEHFNGSTPSFHSSPPLRSMASFRSVSNGPSGSRSRSATSSSRSLRSVSDIQAAIDSGIPIQYPRIRAPSASSRAESSMSSDRDFTPGPVSGRWNPHLSRVSSVWSDDELPDGFTPRETSSAGISEPTAPARAVLNGSQTTSSVWLVHDTDEDEHLDSLTNLPVRPTFPQSLSSGSKRSNSMRSMKRPGTSSSNLFQIIPTWAKVYYCADALGLSSALSIFDQSRPSSARPGTGNSSVFNLMPTPLNIQRPRSPERPQAPQRPVSPQEPVSPQQSVSRQQSVSPQMAAPPRPRSPERVRFVQRRIESDPRDPRAHWVATPEPEEYDIVGGPRRRLRHSWSPHLYRDRRTIQHSASAWTCPSMDSTTEPIFGRRNIQVYSFVLGFIFPLAWVIASFLPLPPQPKVGPEMLESDDDVEMALESQLVDMQRRRYDNARWWRNLNRWMISLGVVIIVIIITMAVIGTTTGF
ncbi:uncharacterized protein N7498_004891 [Penicillium cinerascens]|uniref:Serine-rich protein n=1 Tax=Penicillium cinerascens TaxID=70096 RepID=A0A9W9MMI5_9EURO|nr:uncharacterized protein N7498_004891 [Penicillium cinerascens]KAJ5204012.1 hypothetical protein N7498_004891 [Penicillium cinerascens]